MKKVYYNKLIRDRIPERIQESGGEFEVRELDSDSFKLELLKKTGEEASGLPTASSQDEIVSEIGDILDVVDEIKKEWNISEQDIVESRKKEFQRKGGFTKKLFLLWTSDTGYKTNERKNV